MKPYGIVACIVSLLLIASCGHSESEKMPTDNSTAATETTLIPVLVKLIEVEPGNGEDARDVAEKEIRKFSEKLAAVHGMENIRSLPIVSAIALQAEADVIVWLLNQEEVEYVSLDKKMSAF